MQLFPARGQGKVGASFFEAETRMPVAQVCMTVRRDRARHDHVAYGELTDSRLRRFTVREDCHRAACWEAVTWHSNRGVPASIVLSHRCGIRMVCWVTILVL